MGYSRSSHGFIKTVTFFLYLPALENPAVGGLSNSPPGDFCSNFHIKIKTTAKVLYDSSLLHDPAMRHKKYYIFFEKYLQD